MQQQSPLPSRVAPDIRLGLSVPPEFITIVGTLGVALVAGVISYLAGRSMKTHEWRLAQAREEHAAHKTLYAAFLAEAHRLAVQSTEKKVQSVAELDLLSQHLAEIKLVGTEPVVEAAQSVVSAVLDSHTGEESKVEPRAFYLPADAFLIAARHELQSYRKA